MPAWQVGAFADYQPGEGGGEAAASQQAEPEPEPSSEGGEEPAEESSGGGGGGDYPAHQVMGLPSLSPTMQQGATQAGLQRKLAVCLLCDVTHHAARCDAGWAAEEARGVLAV